MSADNSIKNSIHSPKKIGLDFINAGPFKLAKIGESIEPIKLIRSAPAILKSLFLIGKLSGSKNKALRAKITAQLKVTFIANENKTFLRPKTFGFEDYDSMVNFIVEYFEKTKFRQTGVREFLRIKRRLGNFRRLKGKMFERMLIYSPAFQLITGNLADEFVRKILKNKSMMEKLVTAKGVPLKDLLPDKVTILGNKKLLTENNVTLSDPVMYHSARIKYKKPLEFDGKIFTHAESTDVLHLTEIGLPNGRKLKAISLETEIKTEGAVDALAPQLSAGESRFTNSNVEHIELTDLQGNVTIVKPDDLVLYRSTEIGKSPYKLGVSLPNHEEWNDVDAVAKKRFEASLRKDATLDSSIKNIEYDLAATSQRGFAVIVKGTIQIAPNHLESFISPIFSGE